MKSEDVLVKVGIIIVSHSIVWNLLYCWEYVSSIVRLKIEGFQWWKQQKEKSIECSAWHTHTKMSIFGRVLFRFGLLFMTWDILQHTIDVVPSTDYFEPLMLFPLAENFFFIIFLFFSLLLFTVRCWANFDWMKNLFLLANGRIVS